jgi:DNA-binding response OmpR family regulator
VRALIRRGFNKSGAVIRYEDLELDRHRRRAQRGRTAIQLTAKEFALLEFLMLRAPEPVTRSEIVEHVWDCHFDSETNLVDVYINRLRQKVDQGHPTKLIFTLRGSGYRLGLPK